MHEMRFKIEWFGSCNHRKEPTTSENTINIICRQGEQPEAICGHSFFLKFREMAGIEAVHSPKRVAHKNKIGVIKQFKSRRRRERGRLNWWGTSLKCSATETSQKRC